MFGFFGVVRTQKDGKWEIFDMDRACARTCRYFLLLFSFDKVILCTFYVCVGRINLDACGMAQTHVT